MERTLCSSTKLAKVIVRNSCSSKVSKIIATRRYFNGVAQISEISQVCPATISQYEVVCLYVCVSQTSKLEGKHSVPLVVCSVINE